MIIGVDVDGVLAKYNEALAKVVETTQNLPPGSLKPPTGWNFPNWGLNRESFRIYHTMLMHNIVDMEVYPGAKEALDKLVSLGHTIRIVTSRGSTDLHDTPVKHLAIKGTIEWMDIHAISYH